MKALILILASLVSADVSANDHWTDYLQPGVTEGDIESLRTTFIRYAGVFMTHPEEIRLEVYSDQHRFIGRLSLHEEDCAELVGRASVRGSLDSAFMNLSRKYDSRRRIASLIKCR